MPEESSPSPALKNRNPSAEGKVLARQLVPGKTEALHLNGTEKEQAIVLAGRDLMGGHPVNHALANEVEGCGAVEPKPLDVWNGVLSAVENLSPNLRSAKNCSVAAAQVDKVFKFAADITPMGSGKKHRALWIPVNRMDSHFPGNTRTNKLSAWNTRRIGTTEKLAYVVGELDSTVRGRTVVTGQAGDDSTRSRRLSWKPAIHFQEDLAKTGSEMLVGSVE